MQESYVYKSYKKEKEAASSRGEKEKKKERERKRQRDKRERERERDRGAIWLDAHHSRTRYFLFITQLVLCDKVTTVYCSMVASGWLVLGGAGGSGVCRVFLFSYFRFRINICIYIFFPHFRTSFVSFLGERALKAGRRRAEDASFVRKGSTSQKQREKRAEGDNARFNNLLPWIQTVACRSVPVKITVKSRVLKT